LGLGSVVALAWGYLLYMGWGMEHMEVGVNMAIMPRMTQWGTIDLLLVFMMWVVMMVGMMLPSATPVLIFNTRSQRGRLAHVVHVFR
jgi:predicted metal-binding membrane protein